MACNPQARPETAACFSRGVNHTYTVEFGILHAIAGAILHALLELLVYVTEASAFLLLFGVVLYAQVRGTPLGDWIEQRSPRLVWRTR